MSVTTAAARNSRGIATEGLKAEPENAELKKLAGHAEQKSLGG